MKASKIYTAQEMREMEAIVASGDIGPMTRERVALMLKQAVEMRERCEEVISDVNGPNSRFDHGVATPDFDANEIVDYILKGATNADRKKNALAELAEVMDKPVDMASIHDRGLVVLNAQQFSAYQKAQRIVAELAKVEDRRKGETNSDALWRCNDCIAKCRVIAEEGVKDGK